MLGRLHASAPCLGCSSPWLQSSAPVLGFSPWLQSWAPVLNLGGAPRSRYSSLGGAPWFRYPASVVLLLGPFLSLGGPWCFGLASVLLLGSLPSTRCSTQNLWPHLASPWWCSSLAPRPHLGAPPWFLGAPHKSCGLSAPPRFSHLVSFCFVLLFATHSLSCTLLTQLLPLYLIRLIPTFLRFFLFQSSLIPCIISLLYSLLPFHSFHLLSFHFITTRYTKK
jgi:hypothetical protein